MEEILVPISLGELYDKLTILIIKLTEIKDEEKLKNVQKEYALIKKICENYPIDLQYLIDLLHVNKSLWNVEDKIRIKEAHKTYDEEFVELARQVYFDNDKRSVIKKEINVKYGSNLVEEKSYEKYD
jgi:hypothetical protein